MKKLKLLVAVATLLFTTLTSSVFADTTFVAGNILNQTWTLSGSPYCVTDNIFVSLLTIEPGVRVLFQGNYLFQVNGILTAIGTKQDSICFTKMAPATAWNGILFDNTQAGSVLKYCHIENSKNSGLRIINSIQSISNCNVENNKAANGGGINIYLSNGETLIFKDCKIKKNTSSSHGGGIYAVVEEGLLKLQNCIIDSNYANPGSAIFGNFVGGGLYIAGNVHLANCKIRRNRCESYSNGFNVWSRGGGIYISSGVVNINNCELFRNLSTARGYNWPSWTYAFGGGVFVNSGELTLSNSILAYNINDANGNGQIQRECGSGVFNYGGLSEFKNCTFAYNNNHGVRREGGNVNIINSIFYFNNNNGGQISGDTNNITVSYSNIHNGYSGTANINVNPNFYNLDSLHIQPPSLCIDAGNPDPMYYDACLLSSCDEERNDMGAYGGPGACGWLPVPPDLHPNFSSDLTEGAWPLTVKFTDLTTGDPSNWKWDFQNDGIIDSYAQNPTWTYTEPGVYTVLLRACDGENQDTKIKAAYITVYEKQAITIPSGWSGISSYIDPSDADIENLFSPAENNLVILQNNDGAYWPFAGVNTLGSWDSHAGYQIKMENEQAFTFAGWMENNPAVSLSAGWNYLPVLSFCGNSAADLFSGLTDNLQIVKEIAGVGVYWPAYGVNTLESLIPGKAYFVLMDEAATVTYPECDGMKATVSQVLTGSAPLTDLIPWYMAKPTTITHNVALPLSAFKAGQIQAGELIGAFDANGDCYGAARWSHENTSITIFGDDPTTPEIDGFTTGESIHLKLYSPKTKAESGLSVEFDQSLADHDGTFNGNGLSAIKSTTVISTSANDAIISDIRMYPNPAKDMLHIDLGSVNAAHIDILNIHGQTMLSFEVKDSNKSIDISELPGGLYFVQFKIQNETFFKKLMID